MIEVDVHYFASFRDAAGCASERLKAPSTDARRLFEDLKSRHGFRFSAAQVRLAVNDAFVPWERALVDGDRVVFVPPVSGG